MLNLKEISAVIIQTNHTLSIAKGELDNYLADTSIDLEERWSVFCDAPAAIKNHEPYLVTFDWEQKHGNISWYDDFYTDRYSVVKMQQIVEQMGEGYTDKYNTEQINDMKEEVLAKNLDSFIMDW